MTTPHTSPRSGLPNSLLDNPLLGTWIGFEETGRVRLATGKVEIGQGVLTALAQIAAEELDVSPARLRIVSGETPTSPREGFTSGSNSIAVSGSSIRLVCAEVRALFLRYVADRLACPIGALTIDDGRFLRAGRHIGQDYWSIAGEIDLARSATGDAAPKPPSSYRIVGQSVPRLDLAAKLAGSAFIHDLAPENLLHARMLRRPWSGARLADFDEAAVRRAAGAPIDIVRAGDLVAFTSDDEVAAMRAAQTARGLAAWAGGAKPSSDAGEPSWIWDQRTRDRIVETGAAAGVAGNRVVEASFSRPFLAYGSIGPSCALAEFKDGKLTVWTHSQGVFELRRWLAHALGIDPMHVTVLHRQGAGCYGHNSADDVAFDAAFVAMRMPNRTVRVQWTREDEFSAAPMGSAMVVGLRAVLDANARPADWTIEIWSPVHAQRPGMNGHANLLGAEALPDAPPPAEINDVADEAGGGATAQRAGALRPAGGTSSSIICFPTFRCAPRRCAGWVLSPTSSPSSPSWTSSPRSPGRIRSPTGSSLMSDPRGRRVIETAAEMANWTARRRAMAARAASASPATRTAPPMPRWWRRSRSMSRSVSSAYGRPSTPASSSIPTARQTRSRAGSSRRRAGPLKERVRFADGRVASDSWESYPILHFSEVPEIDIRFIEARHQPALGLGEASLGPTAAAIGNAVTRALGRRIRALPLTRERIMATLLAEN